jgi:hypothetical protein
MVPGRMGDFARETLREARGFAERGEWRLAIQRCELIRSRQRVPESILIETFGILGCAHVELEQYEEALSFLKRAAPTPATIAAAERCYREAGLSGDPRALFERDADRQVRRKRRLLVAAIAGVLSLPVLGCCGWFAWVIADGFAESAELAAAYETRRAEGARAGAGRTIAECIDRSVARWTACTGSAEALARCRMEVVAYRDGCYGVAIDGAEYCAGLPPDEALLDERCDGREEPARTACIEAVQGARFWCDYGTQ